jgi:hypothetical protein
VGIAKVEFNPPTCVPWPIVLLPLMFSVLPLKVTLPR